MAAPAIDKSALSAAIAITTGASRPSRAAAAAAAAAAADAALDLASRKSTCLSFSCALSDRYTTISDFFP